MKLKEWLTKQGLNQADFADDIGVNRSLVGRWISGENLPNVFNLRAIETRTRHKVAYDDFDWPVRSSR